MGQIKLTNGKTAIVDDDMVDQLSIFNWFFEQGYARRWVLSHEKAISSRIHMSHVVAGITDEQRLDDYVVDHINFNRLDNRRENLRIVKSIYNRKHHSPEAKEKQRQNIKKATAVAAKLPRTKLQLDHARKQAKALNALGKNRHCGANNYASKKVICIESGIIFDSVAEAAASKGRVYSTVRAWLNGSNPNPSSLRNLKDVYVY